MLHGGDVVLPHRHAVDILQVIHQTVKGLAHRLVIVLGGEIPLHLIPEDGLKGVLLALGEAAAPADVVIAIRGAVIIVLQGQHQQDAVVLLPGAHAQPGELRRRIVGDVGAAGSVHHLHGDLGASLGEQAGVHGVHILGGLFRDNALGITNVLIAAHHSGGGLAGILRFPGLADDDARHNGQHHDYCRHGAFFKNFHRQFLLYPEPLQNVPARAEGG